VRRIVDLVLTLAFVSGAAVAGAATPEVVLNDPGVKERSPSVSDGYLVWSADKQAGPHLNHLHSYVMPEGGSPVRINPAGTRSFGAAIDGTTIVYQEDTGGDRDLLLFDAVTEERTEPPDGVNTPNFEYEPTLSGDWLLFTRTNGNRVEGRDAWVKIVLFDLAGGTGTAIEKLPLRRYYLESGQVNGDWATFGSCSLRQGFSDCQVTRYQISTEEAVVIDNPTGMQLGNGAVSGDGTVYLARTRTRQHWECGNHNRLVRVPVGEPGVVIAKLLDGREVFETFAFDESGGSTTLYFDRVTCETNASGIYRIANADTLTP
jgi:hypothetical protein